MSTAEHNLALQVPLQSQLGCDMSMSNSAAKEELAQLAGGGLLPELPLDLGALVPARWLTHAEVYCGDLHAGPGGQSASLQKVQQREAGIKGSYATPMLAVSMKIFKRCLDRYSLLGSKQKQ